MKCIEGEYGNICKEGSLFSKKTVVQDDVRDSRKYKFRLSDIKKLLRAYNRGEHGKNSYYGIIRTENTCGAYEVYFNYTLGGKEYPIKIGCKDYTKEVVDRAIKAFL